MGNIYALCNIATAVAIKEKKKRFPVFFSVLLRLFTCLAVIPKEGRKDNFSEKEIWGLGMA